MTTGSACVEASHLPDYRPRLPVATLKAIGRPVFRSQEARDYACLLDLDPDVVSWQSFTHPLTDIGECRDHHYVDLEVQTATASLMVEVCTGDAEAPSWLPCTLKECGFRYRMVRFSELNPVRVANARDLIRYAKREATLGDRLRVLSALDEMGTLTLTECLTAVREGRAMETIASLILRGHVEVDLDENLLAPDTVVRRCAK
ncbi:hypothetical protein [Shinella sp.]|uniref:hypothetical protein n=1 Tax=Shinella sp. TaxID=1870904 RepID=UPI0028965F46|nr:hypothetical protein [Shinella sp.]